MEGIVVRFCSCLSLLLLPRCCHIWKSCAEMFSMWRFAILRDMLTSKVGVSYLGGREKFDEVALQAVGSFSMCIGFWVGTVSMGFSRHINVMVFVGAVTGVVKIQTSGATLVGRLEIEALHICKEHLEAISTLLFAYRAAMQDGGLANGWRGVVMLQNCPLASWHAWNSVMESSTAIVASLVTPKFLVCTS